MPVSIWLLPPAGSPVAHALASLIRTTLPPHFAPESLPAFEPHLTVTSGVDESLARAPGVLAGVNIAELNGPEIVFKRLVIGDTLTTRVTLYVEKTPQLESLAQQCRYKYVAAEPEDAEAWAKDEFTPHVSLVYSEMPREQVEKNLGSKLESAVKGAGIVMGGTGESVGGEIGGWKGGRLWLVDTSKPFAEWKPMAERVLP